MSDYRDLLEDDELAALEAIMEEEEAFGINDSAEEDILNDRGTPYKVSGGSVIDAETAQGQLELFGFIIELPYLVSAAQTEMFFERAKARALQLGVGRRIFSPQLAYTEMEKAEAEYFCGHGPVGIKIDA